jgi:hypothetical protein
MNWMTRILRKERRMRVDDDNVPFDSAVEGRPVANRFKLLRWFAGVILIFALLYGTSYLALCWLPPYEGVDMKSRLAADYSAWPFGAFQPVDPAIIEEVRQERGLPEQMVIDGSFWPTPAGMPTMPSTERDTPTSTPQATFDDLPSSPTASEPPSTLTSVPTSITPLPGSTVNPQPTQAANPKKTRKPAKTPKPHKTPKP